MKTDRVNRERTQRKKSKVTMVSGQRLWRSVSWEAVVTLLFEVLRGDLLVMISLNLPISKAKRVRALEKVSRRYEKMYQTKEDECNLSAVTCRIVIVSPHIGIGLPKGSLGLHARVTR